MAGIPKRLIFVTVAATADFAAQFVIHHSNMPELNFPNWWGSSPAPIAGVASVIDGDTIEIHGRRVGANGIDAPESAQRCHDAKGFRYQCGAN
ncbi:thermonuclease family protein, partial [Mesorhizobium sp. BR1-1-6]|uniref:thermonuclease family protein n=1 Tax=Mesorhizobium sp. BR1-1-6 TaxID=2876648 RepID=UPI00398D3A8F